MNQKLASLAFALAIPKFFSGHKGRMKSIMVRLNKAGDLELDKTPLITPETLQSTVNMIDKWYDATGWGTEIEDILRVVSFVAEFDTLPRRIIDILMEVLDYYERAGKFNASSAEEGARVKKLWDDIVIGMRCGYVL